MGTAAGAAAAAGGGVGAAPQRYDEEAAADVIPPHRTGMEGRLHLSLLYDGARTIIAGQRAEPPLAVQRALYCEQSLPGMAYVYVTSTSGGILQGDRHVTRFDLGGGARAHITTQGATRIYGTRDSARTEKKPAARASLRMSLGESSYLEYMPDQIIPYAGSRFRQDAVMSVHETATLVYAETVSPGRVGMGESFEYESCSLRMRVTDQNGRFRFVDAARMEPRVASLQSSPSASSQTAYSLSPSSQPSDSTQASSLQPQSADEPELDIKSFGIMEEYDVVSSLYVITEKKHVESLQKGMDGAILQHGEVAGGATVMSGNTGVMARLLGRDTESVGSAVTEAAAYARKVVLGAPFTGIRKS